MKFVLAFYGTRGDAEPGTAVGRELVRRGHDVSIAVSPDLVGFAESVGLAAYGYGPDSQTALDRDFGANLFKDFPARVWTVKDLTRLWREYWDFLSESWVEMSKTLISLADGADLLFTHQIFEDGAANVAEYYGIPLATMHYAPIRENSQLVPAMPALGRSAMTMFWWLAWGLFGKFENEQRRELDLPKVKGPAPRRITDRGALEIQAYDEVCFPGLGAEWASWNGQRPFVGPLTMALPTDADPEVAAWIAEGKPPICFAFGSMLMQSPVDMLTMIAAACARLGERALICSGVTDFGDAAQFEHVKVVGAVNYAATFPACRAVVHHGGVGTTAAGLRAGVPTLILWAAPDRRMWGARVKHLKVGTARRFSNTTRESLVADLRTILAPEYVARARELGARMTPAAESVATTCDHLEHFARVGRVSGSRRPRYGSWETWKNTE